MADEESTGMPVFVLKAQDKLALHAIVAYKVACVEAGLDDQAVEVGKAALEFHEWQDQHPDRVKMPDHKHVPTAGR